MRAKHLCMFIAGFTILAPALSWAQSDAAAQSDKAPQAWASATPFTFLEAALGLEFDSERGEIRLRNPRLPVFLNEVVLRELRLGPSSVDLRVRRHGDEVSLEVLRTRGHIQVSIVLAQ